MNMKVIVVGAESDLPPEMEKIEAVANVIPVNSAEEFARARKEADVVFMWQWDSDLVAQAGPGGLSWVHVNSIGVDALLTQEVADSELIISNTRGVFEPPVAEWVLSALLFMAKDMRGTVELQRQGTWKPRPVDMIRGRRALVLGPGGVGREIALLLRAAGYTVDIVGRTSRDEPELGRIRSTADLNELLAHADDVILAAPLTEETRGILSAERLAKMRKGARLVNAGRGPLVDERALLERLQEGHLAAAALDVFNQEPLDSSHPFWSMENVLVSPHMASYANGWESASVDVFLKNLERWMQGDKLKHVVNAKKLIHVSG
ncbi:D-2-hydroxyacid dehydrogenase [Arthrobacter sp. Alg241-R88]|uniref:D-2-hydroxyacid dehydrogenase n=1 Tax=Arthrobacter sp. Alg241-R88 TaxID=2305984 RepID=UPI0013D30C21|nr:D-2-hydroxyacid dehydrogenase [Arthrobacter sp. Alg241-R88]